MVGEGEWGEFFKSKAYRVKKEADKISYMWDRLLQRTTQNALDGKLYGDGGIFDGNSAVYEMAKEPRFSRRGLSHAMSEAIENFPDTQGNTVRNLSFMPSYFPDTAYVFLQVQFADGPSYTGESRNLRFTLLKIACGVAKNKNPHLKKVVGIAMTTLQNTHPTLTLRTLCYLNAMTGLMTSGVSTKTQIEIGAFSKARRRRLQSGAL